jgi:hypothetical protein
MATGLDSARERSWASPPLCHKTQPRHRAPPTRQPKSNPSNAVHRRSHECLSQVPAICAIMISKLEGRPDWTSLEGCPASDGACQWMEQ